VDPAAAAATAAVDNLRTMAKKRQHLSVLPFLVAPTQEIGKFTHYDTQ
jgi:hypothetical protein